MVTVATAIFRVRSPPKKLKVASKKLDVVLGGKRVYENAHGVILACLPRFGHLLIIPL